jgi:hypothetical protein
MLLLGFAGCASHSGAIGRSAGTELNLDRLIVLLNQEFPNKDADASYAYPGLLFDFRHFGIATVEEAKRIIVENRSYAEAEEAKWQALYGPRKERSYNYSCVGMARHALRKHVGEKIFDDYEVEGRPNQ